MIKSKKIPSFPLELINYNKILSVPLWMIQNQNKNPDKKNLNIYQPLLKNFFRTLKWSILTSPKIKFPKNKTLDIFYIRNYSRPDLAKHSKYFENIDNTTICVLTDRKKKIDIVKFIHCSFLLFKSKKLWLKVLKNNGVSFFSTAGLNMFFMLFSSFSDALKVLPAILMHSKLVSYQEMLGAENILCQLANINNIETFALEHGISVYDEKGSYWSQFSIVPYSSSVCKNILCAGNYSKNQFKKFTSANIFLIGKPGLISVKNALDGVTFVFGGSVFDKTKNMKLLSISNNLSDLGIPVSRWYKPGSSLIKNNITRDGPLRNIVIGYSSNLIIELGFLGLKVFTIKDSPITILHNNLILEDPKLIANKYQSNDSYPHDFWKSFIDCTGDESLKRYKNILKKII